MIYAKLALGAALLAAIAWGAMADYSAGKKAGQNAVQVLWDQDRAKIQAAADAAIAQATKQKDEALAANEVIQNGYQTLLSAANANAAEFAQRLRSAESRLAANSHALSQDSSGSKPVDPGTDSSADQLGKLAQLTADLHAECTANAAQLNALAAQVKPQM